MSASKREEQAESRREQLLDVALKLFGEVGVERTTIKALAQAAGVSQGLIYHYFTSKDDLLAQVMDRHSLSLHLELEEAVDQSATTVLPALAERLVQEFSARREVVWIFFREIRTNETVAAQMERRRQECMDKLATYLQGRVQAGELRPHRTEVTARSFLAVLFMIHLTGLPDEGFLEEFVNSLLHGILV
ncbi:MAG: TetR/AcrR family transcriptional regulator [Candidatus Eremiobacteraeota bacterium]|nr:TetR/AcrR family transcriptional regulator [Candidatus Eremiobacteraeota bacterium]